MKCLEQKFEPTLPICLPILQFLYLRNQKVLENRCPIEVIDGTGKMVEMKIQETEEVVKRTAKLFDRELKERFVEVGNNIPTYISAACMSDPRQKGVDLDEKSYEEAKTMICDRLKSLMKEQGCFPLRPNEDLSSEDDDRYAKWDDEEELEVEEGFKKSEKNEAEASQQQLRNDKS